MTAKTQDKTRAPQASPRDQRLSQEGWTRRGTFDEPRLSDIAEMYEELGYVVRLEPFLAEEEPGCVACMRLTPELFKTIYTKEKS